MRYNDYYLGEKRIISWMERTDGCLYFSSWGSLGEKVTFRLDCYGG